MQPLVVYPTEQIGDNALSFHSVQKQRGNKPL